MTIDVETLLVRLEATQTKFEKQMAASYRTADRRSNQIERRFAQMNRNLQRSTSNAALSVNRALGTIGAGLGVREVAAYADAWTTAGNKLRAAAQSSGVQVRSLNELKEGANDARTGLEPYVDLYARLIRSASGVAKSELEIAQATNIVSKAFKAGGATVREQASGILQLGQALGSGVLQGDELRSLRESAPIIAKAIAEEFKTNVAGLKQLGAEGKLTSERVFKAIIAAQDDIEAQFAKTNATIADSMTRINNEFTAYIGNADQASGASAKLVEALQYVADNFEGVADTIVSFATVLIGAFTGKAIVGTVLGLGRAVAALGVFLTAVSSGTLVLTSFAAALGPIGLLAGAAAASYFLFSGNVADANAELAKQAGTANQVQGSIDELVKAQKAYEQAIINTKGSQSSTTKSIVADTKKEFEAKRSLLQLELKRQQALLAQQRASLQQRTSGIFEAANRNRTISRRVRGSDTAGTNLPSADGFLATDAIDSQINQLGDGYKRLAAEAQLTEVSISKLNEAINTSFDAPEYSGFGDAKPTGSGSSKGGKSFSNDLERVRQRIGLIQAETAALASLNPHVNDYGFAVERAKIQQQLLSSAKRNGIPVTASLAAQISELANEYAQATVTSKQLVASQELVQKRAEEMNEFGRDTLGGFIRDLRDGKSASEALAGALEKVADKLLDVALNAAFDSKGGGLFSSVLGSIFGFGGGFPAPGQIGLFDKGGFTGHGGTHEAKGVVHGGEYVFKKKRVQQLGLANLERLHRGYADGGFVGRISSAPPSGGGYRDGSPMALHVHASQKNEFYGHKSADMVAIEDQQRERDLSFESNVVTAVRKAIADRQLQSNDF